MTSRSVIMKQGKAFPYLMMKLFVFSDRKADQNKDLGRHHALDLYTIVGMMTEDEYETARRLAQDHLGDANVQKAREIVREDFQSNSSPGVVRLREHPLFRPAFLDQQVAGRRPRRRMDGGSTLDTSGSAGSGVRFRLHHDAP